MKKASALLLLSLLPLAPNWAQEKTASPLPVLDRVVAVVGKEPITSLELDSRLKQTILRLKSQKIALPQADVLEKQMLDFLIFERIQLQYARNEGVVIDDLELSRIIDQIAAEQGLTLAQYQKKVSVDGAPWSEARQQLRTEIIIARLRARYIDNNVKISNAAVTQAINDLKNTGKPTDDEVSLAQIMIRVPEKASNEEINKIRQQAESVLQKAQNGEPFNTLAATYSNAPEALEGGGLGTGPLDSWPPIFANAVKEMKVGDISPILRSPRGFHILKLLSRQDNLLHDTFPQSHVRYILINQKYDRNEEQAHALAQSLVTRLHDGESFATLARNFSDDPSAANGGDLDWIIEDELPPSVEEKMETLALNEIGGPISVQNGWAILQVLERRNDRLSDRHLRQKTLTSLRNARARESYDDWLRQLRAQAFVEVYPRDQ